MNSSDKLVGTDHVVNFSRIPRFFKRWEVQFLPADMMALKWRTPNEHDTFSGEDFSELADEYGYKTSKYGFWQKVMTPQGEAREFMYIDGTMLDYLYRKYQRVA